MGRIINLKDYNKKKEDELRQLFYALSDHLDICECKEGPLGRTVTEDFEYQVCDRCGKECK